MMRLRGRRRWSCRLAVRLLQSLAGAMLGLGIGWALPAAAWAREALVIQVGPALQAGGSISTAIETALREASLEVAKASPGTAVIVQLPPGMIRLDRPLRLDAAISGSAAVPLRLQGASDGSTTLSGSRVLGNFESSRDPELLARLPEVAHGRVLQAAWTGPPAANVAPRRRGFLHPAAPVSFEVLFRGRPMPVAGWPNGAYTRIVAAPDGPKGGRFLLEGAQARGANWMAEPGLVAFGYWFHDWCDETIPIASQELSTGVMTLSGGAPGYGIKVGQRVRMVNALAELDSPGEWYFDVGRKSILFWPPEPVRDGDVEVSVLDGLIRTAGSSHVEFRDLRMEGARGDALVIQGGRGVRMIRLAIRSVGGRGVVMSGEAHALVDSSVEDTGQGGVVMVGGDRQTLQPGRLLAEGNRLVRTARLVTTYRPAIQVGGVGQLVRHNWISEVPHSAIIYQGNDHLIELNQIHDAALDTGDVGAIYTGRDWTARGTRVRYNYLHDIHGVGDFGSSGVYLDDQASGIQVQGNLFVRVNRAVLLGGGRDNEISDNLMVASAPALFVDARGMNAHKAMSQAPDGDLMKRLRAVPFDKEPYASRYPGLAALPGQEPGRPLGNRVERNRVIAGGFLRSTAPSNAAIFKGNLVDGAVALVESSAVQARRPAVDYRTLPTGAAGVAQIDDEILRAMDCARQRWSGRSWPLRNADDCLRGAPGGPR